MKGLNFGKIYTGIYDGNFGYYAMDNDDKEKY